MIMFVFIFISLLSALNISPFIDVYGGYSFILHVMISTNDVSMNQDCFVLLVIAASLHGVNWAALLDSANNTSLISAYFCISMHILVLYTVQPYKHMHAHNNLSLQRGPYSKCVIATFRKIL